MRFVPIQISIMDWCGLSAVSARVDNFVGFKHKNCRFSLVLLRQNRSKPLRFF